MAVERIARWRSRRARGRRASLPRARSDIRKSSRSRSNGAIASAEYSRRLRTGTRAAALVCAPCGSNCSRSVGRGSWPPESSSHSSRPSSRSGSRALGISARAARRGHRAAARPQRPERAVHPDRHAARRAPAAATATRAKPARHSTVSARFGRALRDQISQSSWTKASMASLWTGALPRAHRHHALRRRAPRRCRRCPPRSCAKRASRRSGSGATVGSPRRSASTRASTCISAPIATPLPPNVRRENPTLDRQRHRPEPVDAAARVPARQRRQALVPLPAPDGPARVHLRRGLRALRHHPLGHLRQLDPLDRRVDRGAARLPRRRWVSSTTRSSRSRRTTARPSASAASRAMRARSTARRRRFPS